MKTIAIICCMLLLPFALGCSSSKNADSGSMPEMEAMPNPVAGTWATANASDTIHFMDGGEVMFEQGDILASINRFQNTERSKYISRLQKKGMYEWTNEKELVLTVMADWTGKGTGARRPADKTVESHIAFMVESMDDSQITLKKTNLTQGDQANLHADEDLTLTLMRKP